MKSLSSRTFLLEFWEERGEKLMTCHLFLDNYWDFTTFGLFFFKGLRVFETDFCFKKTQVSQFWYHEMFVISESCLSQKTVLLQKIDCVFVLAIRGLLHMTKNFVMWCDFCVFNHYYRILFSEKFFWENHGVVENMCSFSKSYL